MSLWDIVGRRIVKKLKFNTGCATTCFVNTCETSVHVYSLVTVQLSVLFIFLFFSVLPFIIMNKVVYKGRSKTDGYPASLSFNISTVFEKNMPQTHVM